MRIKANKHHDQTGECAKNVLKVIVKIEKDRKLSVCECLQRCRWTLKSTATKRTFEGERTLKGNRHEKTLV